MLHFRNQVIPLLSPTFSSDGLFTAHVISHIILACFGLPTLIPACLISVLRIQQMLSILLSTAHRSATGATVSVLARSLRVAVAETRIRSASPLRSLLLASSRSSCGSARKDTTSLTLNFVRARERRIRIFQFKNTNHTLRRSIHHSHERGLH